MPELVEEDGLRTLDTLNLLYVAFTRAELELHAFVPNASDAVTKGLAAMALTLLADRGALDWDAPVAAAWPGFAAAGKGAITVRTLVNHQAGLLGLDTPLTMDDCVRPDRQDHLRRALEQQAPAWAPGTRQGYHAITFGMYVRELFERLAGDDLGGFLRRELFAPLGADVDLGTPADVDARIATLYPPSNRARLGHMLRAALGGSTEGKLARAVLRPGSWPRAAFLNPRTGPAAWLECGSRRLRVAEGGLVLPSPRRR